MPRLRVLLYHSISADGSRDDLTVSAAQLEAQFQHLRRRGYNSILLSDLIAYYERRRSLPPKPVLITFDDGFLNHVTVAYPLAKKYRMKINLFVIPFFIRTGGYRSTPCAQPADLEKMDPALVEVGLHSYAHLSYADLHPEEIEFDIDRGLQTLQEMGIAYQPCLAYPFGAFPRGPQNLFELLQRKGIRLAFRIGNRINSLPLREKFLIQRIDVRGDESLVRFRLSLGFGRKLW
ncbi:MAG TPA: polysaccharide deacetylase family protein [Puia sp.]|nr:polysaccharide deacetylase family protein [Puia sp.]